jgi:FO synthase
MEITYGMEKTGMPLADYLLMLREAGLGSIPGTAAEILDDEVRGNLSPNKLRVAQWVDVVRAAHRLGIRSSCTMMYGHTETRGHWVRHMALIREIQRETGGFTEFVPLGFIHADTRLYKKGHSRAGHTRDEDLIVHALARLFFRNTIPNVQVSWVKLGFETSLDALNAGANDFSGTLMEESISKAAGSQFGESVAPEELRALIRSIGRVPAERTTTYGIRKIFFESEGAERMPAQNLAPLPTHAAANRIGY